MPVSAASPLGQLVERAGVLYTLPTVALEVVRLLNQPHTDPRDIKNCLEGDPALTAKILKVVNSSLFGLSGEVANLNQALALLGMQPLKLLVLGFCLPDELTANLTGEELRKYWTTTLTRALAARTLAERYWPRTADDALTAGLLQGVGRLVMLQQLGAPYAQFLTKLATETGNPLELERYALGFDHAELSAALLRHWRLPEKLTIAIERSAQGGEWGVPVSEEQTLAVILRLAEQISQLVGDRRLSVLPDLLALGDACCGMTRAHLSELVGQLQPRVEQLAAALTVELEEARDYRQVLVEAHAQLAVVSTQAAQQLLAAGKGGDDELCETLLAEARDLSVAMQKYLQSRRPVAPSTEARRADGARSDVRRPRGAVSTDHQPLLAALRPIVAECRRSRQSITLLLLELSSLDAAEALLMKLGAHLWQSVKLAVANDGLRPATTHRYENVVALALADVTRQEAVQWAYAVERAAQNLASSEITSAELLTLDVKAGVSHVALVPNNFDPTKLWDNAHRCLAAAQAASGSTVKSIEVY